MSRIGRKPVVVPAGVEVTVDANNAVTVKGPKGQLTEQISARPRQNPYKQHGYRRNRGLRKEDAACRRWLQGGEKRQNFSIEPWIFTSYRT